MAKLTTNARNKLPASTFAGPGRTYPIPDASHAANAKARASQAVNAGRMTHAQEAKIDAKADKLLGGAKSKPRAREAPPSPAAAPANPIKNSGAHAHAPKGTTEYRAIKARGR